MKTSKAIALPPKGHITTPKEIARLGGIDVHIGDRGGVNVVGVPIGTDAYAMKSAMETVKNGGAEQLARILPHVPHKQSAI